MAVGIHFSPVEEALSCIKSGDRVFVHGSACTPTYLLKHLAMRHAELNDIELVFISVYGDMHVDKPEYRDSFKLNSMFVSNRIRADVNESYADYILIFLSEIAELFKHDILTLDVALVQVSPRL